MPHTKREFPPITSQQTAKYVQFVSNFSRGSFFPVLYVRTPKPLSHSPRTNCLPISPNLMPNSHSVYCLDPLFWLADWFHAFPIFIWSQICHSRHCRYPRYLNIYPFSYIQGVKSRKSTLKLWFYYCCSGRPTGGIGEIKSYALCLRTERVHICWWAHRSAWQCRFAVIKSQNHLPNIRRLGANGH